MTFIREGASELSRISTIKLDWREARGRPQSIAGAFVIDDCCLLEHCERASKQTYDLVSPIGWTLPQYQVEFAERLLLRIPAKLPSGRRELLVCSECGDVGCGCISANVSSEGDYFVWEEIRHENNYDLDSLTIFPMGRFLIPKDNLLNQFRSHIAGLR